MNFTVGKVGAFCFAQKSIQQSYAAGSSVTKTGNVGENVTQIRRTLAASGREENASYASGIIGDCASYGDSIRASRMKAKNTSLNLKKIRYQFKSISTQLMRCKTSISAKQVAAKARREVIRLKRQNQSGQSQYDDQELQSAIVHAQAMERLAKKKAKHLEEEEMVKIASGFMGEETGEKEERSEKEGSAQVTRELTVEQKTSVSYQENVSAAAYSRRIEYREAEAAQNEALRTDNRRTQELREEDAQRERQLEEQRELRLRQEQEERAHKMQEAREEQARQLQEMMREQAEQLQEMMRRQMEELRSFTEEASGSLTDQMNEQMKKMLDDMSDSMKKMLEESGLSELLEDMGVSIEREMEPADYKMMKIKHRSEEMRDLARADAEYLKALFNSLEKQKDAILQGISGAGSQGAGSGFSAMPTGAMPNIGSYNAASVQNQVTSQINAQFSASVSSFSVAEAFTVEGGGMDVSV